MSTSAGSHPSGSPGSRLPLARSWRLRSAPVCRSDRPSSLATLATVRVERSRFPDGRGVRPSGTSSPRFRVASFASRFAASCPSRTSANDASAATLPGTGSRSVPARPGTSPVRRRATVVAGRLGLAVLQEVRAEYSISRIVFGWPGPGGSGAPAAPCRTRADLRGSGGWPRPVPPAHVGGRFRQRLVWIRPRRAAAHGFHPLVIRCLPIHSEIGGPATSRSRRDSSCKRIDSSSISAESSAPGLSSSAIDASHSRSAS